MRRLPTLLLSLSLLAGVATPASAAPVDPPPMPPATPTAAPPTDLVPATDLTRLGRLRIPGIDLEVPVYRWGCRDDNLPNKALRWKCSGANNQFIVGHAYGVFHPYYLAWKHDRFRIGMAATFRDADGRLTRYQLAWVRKVPRNYVWNGKTGDQWAWNETATPSITLQTCWGATNKYRIVARWVKV